MLNEIWAVVSLLVQIQNGQPIGTATGFFYLKNNIVYLVTNRHVVLDEAKNIKPDALRLKLHVDPSNLAKNVDFEVPLYSKGIARWYVHQDYASKKIDVAVVEVDQERLKRGHFVKALSAANFFPSNYVMQPGEDVMVIGFPRGISDIRHNLPLIRNAIIASAYGVPFQGSPVFLIDANLHPGMSGSPVLTKPKNMWQDDKGNTNLVTGSPIYFLGVHSATLSVALPSGQEPLGLGSVWYASLIEEIIESFKKK